VTERFRESDAFRGRIARKGMPERAEEVYGDWALRFVRFHGRRQRRELGVAEVEKRLVLSGGADPNVGGDT